MTVPYPSPRTALPHSYPFLLIDRILDLDEGKRIVCLKNVTINEEFFQGHFKDNPVMPGSLIIEAMAQTSGLMIVKEKSSMAYLGKIKDAKFRKMVVPGDQLIITSSLIDKFPPFYTFEVIASVGSEIVSEAEIILSLS
ncbi:MAG: 3-hydroxyacyl-[acyl-carrier-protein] dehydratase FabZ [Candidatus Brocadia sp.]|jgi:3-hydroxymyristoyl/3-hydroxydecanoyl-(acyl carrier protein) dehydratases|uniref:3-hydroxyacyl-[acyl-carrier-protein] dehydratase n=1 Tax=Candidatus Brocadia fulgida TaxID=380242 RepID=A0A0M2UTP9_9BACT|nr:MAG: putative (3R)-hydroxymyristoyl-(acyl-carrier-protein) dehydrase [Candidatus Brocadia fulgida]MCC6326651.1 3-hydroxyacyl-ACP dehydratase FabZ [Candidatus Brocadia sp.]MCE7910235.1 beta-hydroxyacyl-ACP dehydratase [Candidatus Brocadia sp. AMX3]MBV6518279.1 3-hydroxyacyl-[acyl-carrier-protein] dehydratase FabZ [Candidatus Brocadia fulgida]MDG5997043.1 beta-hydroxyacyl-ACP dehydratase [Candidatus Brocadia sp.]